MDWFDSWALSLATFIPMVGMAVVLAIPKAKEALIKQVTLLATALSLLVGVIILFRFDYDAADKLQFSVNKSWIDVISSRYHMGLDGISLPLMILTMGMNVARLSAQESNQSIGKPPVLPLGEEDHHAHRQRDQRGDQRHLLNELFLRPRDHQDHGEPQQGEECRQGQRPGVEPVHRGFRSFLT